MSNSDEAREKAWREQPARLRDATPRALAGAFRELFDIGWDARAQHDEQRIAALDVAIAIARLERARRMVADLCEGKQRWVMHVPAEPDRDPDLVLVSGIDAALVALRALAGQTDA